MDLKISSIGVEEEKCIGCDTCKDFCPKGGKVWEIKERAIWCMDGTENTEHCHACTNCVLKCPQKAISVIRHDN